MSIIKLSVNNSVLINLIMILVIVFGVFTVFNMPKEEMPPVDFGSAIIVVAYPGVTPSEIETQIVKKIEDEISDVDDLDYIESTCTEGKATISVNFKPNANTDDCWNNLNSELNKVKDLPKDAMDPVAIRLNMREVNEICDVAISGDFSENSLRNIADELKDRILDIDHVSKTDVSGTRERQIWVEGDLKKLEAYGLTLDDISNAIRMRNNNYPNGTIKYGAAEFLVRTVGEFNKVDDIGHLIISTDNLGNSVKLSDVATVKDTLEEQNVISKLDGEKSVTIFVYKDVDGNIIDVVKDVRKEVKAFAKNNPGVKAVVRNDGSIEVSKSMKVLGSNAVLGIILVFFSLWIFIGWRNAILAAWGIPFSFLLAFIIMNAFDITINNLSLFALILVLGMIVDDAIVVLENVHRYLEMGFSPKEATIKGAEEIMWPVIAAVLTTIAAFIPMLMMSGMMGKFMHFFPIVVSIALAASLFEALFVLPSHVAEMAKPINVKTHKISPIQIKITNGYRKIIKAALKHRIITVLSVIFALILSGMVIVFQLIPLQFFPQHTPKTLKLQLTTPIGTELDKTNEVVTRIENHLETMKERHDIESIVTTVGSMILRHQWEEASSNAEIRMDFIDADEMKYPLDEIKNSLRKFMNTIPEITSYKFKLTKSGPPTGEDIELRVKGNKLTTLKEISDYLEKVLEKIPGVTDISSTYSKGKDELRIIPNYEQLGIYGITTAQISSAVRTALYGSTVSTFRGGDLDEYDIIVKEKPDNIDNLSELANLKIRTRTGNLVPLKDLAELKQVDGIAEIVHRDRKRIVTITADVSNYQDNGRTITQTPNNVKNILFGNKIKKIDGKLANFEKKFPGYILENGGQAEEQKKSYTSLMYAFIVALFLVFAILATQFKSYVQPLIVMLTIPFSFIGVIFGLLVTRLPFSLNTMISVVALAGVVVNDSLVLVDFVNKERELGMDRWHSLINAGVTRLRPILLTTITTIFGMAPMIISTSTATQDWKPMAVSISFGLAFATILTLVVIPVIYSLVDSLFGRLGITRFKTHISFEEAMAQDDAKEE